jgi:hypothetical protein
MGHGPASNLNLNSPRAQCPSIPATSMPGLVWVWLECIALVTLKREGQLSVLWPAKFCCRQHMYNT